MISIVITSYNRIALVVVAINSALAFIEEIGLGEIIIVDDYSTDGTVDYLSSRYKSELNSGRISLIRHERNMGVTGAKNTGARASTEEWVMFLDSDDKLIMGVASIIKYVVQRAQETCPVVFFRCIGEDGLLIGAPQKDEVSLGLSDFLCQGTPGECLPIVRRSHFIPIQYDEDLRGFEGLTYCKMIREFGPCLVSPVRARVYCIGTSNSLSAPKKIRERGCRIALGYIRMLQQFFSVLSISGKIRVLGKATIHISRCVYSRIIT